VPRIPKSAQRHIDALNRIRREGMAKLNKAIEMKVAAYDGPVPRRMAVDETPSGMHAAHDVYLNGVKQRLCIVADMDKGYVKRYVSGVGNIPLRNRKGNTDTELLFGDVQIVRKGTKLGSQ